MAKKAVATFGGEKSTGKNSIKCIRLVRSSRSGAYAFREEIVPIDQVTTFFEEKK